LKNKKFSIIERINSFKYAFNGLKILFQEEHNSRVHLFSTIVVIILGFILKISFNEWFALILSCGFVFVTEILNSSIENIADFISPQRNDHIKKVKDLSAAAVLISAIAALIIGLLIFSPKIYQLCIND
jgi:undecaprenol kinase/diacylglycerol kinase (ATP)